MDDAPAVGIVEGGRDIASPGFKVAGHLIRRLPNALGERARLDVVHDEEESLVLDIKVCDRHDALMTQLSADASLLPETLDELWLSAVRWMKEFDRMPGANQQVASGIDRPEAAPPE